MRVRFIFFVFGILLTGKVVSQTNIQTTKYREDQFYLSFSLLLQQESLEGFKQNGFSNNFQIGFVRDMPLNSQGTWAMGLGLGYGFNRLISNLNVEKLDGKFIFEVDENQKNLQTFSSLVIPLSFRFRTSTAERTDFWRIYGGLKYKLNFAAKFNPFYGSSSKNEFIRKNNTAVFLSMGFNTWNIALEYDLSPIYVEEAQTPEGADPNIQILKLGLVFYIF
ncbi:MAG: hypothetical protein VW127_00775 [Flavobacteriaceae bacterium]|jgi:hypothetical protein